MYGNRGPGQIGVNRHGIWMASHSSPNIAFVTHEGRLVWVNRNGDEIGDFVSNEDANLGLRALHIAPAAGTTASTTAADLDCKATDGNTRRTRSSVRAC